MNKIQPEVERARHFHAFEVYRDLGYGRTYRGVSKLVDASPTSVAKWAKIFKWDERIASYNAGVVKKEEAGDLVKSDDPIVQKVIRALRQMESVIDGAFTETAEGKIEPLVKVKSISELTLFVTEYRRFLETYHKFVEEFMPAGKAKDRDTRINELNVYLGNISQEERIKVLETLKNGNEQRGNTPTEGRVQDADFTEVPESGSND